MLEKILNAVESSSPFFLFPVEEKQKESTYSQPDTANVESPSLPPVCALKQPVWRSLWVVDGKRGRRERQRDRDRDRKRVSGGKRKESNSLVQLSWSPQLLLLNDFQKAGAEKGGYVYMAKSENFGLVFGFMVFFF